MIAKLIPTRIHGVLDYLFGLLFVVLPWLMGWTGEAAWIMMVLGVGVLVYSILTRYELGLVKVIPMNVHLIIDLLGGLLLVASPFLFFTDPNARIWYIVLGVIEIGAALLSSNQPAGVGLEDVRTAPNRDIEDTMGTTSSSYRSTTSGTMGGTTSGMNNPRTIGGTSGATTGSTWDEGTRDDTLSATGQRTNVREGERSDNLTR